MEVFKIRNLFKKLSIIAWVPILIMIFSITIFAIEPSDEELINGIDVSDWQGRIDYARVKDDGIEIVYIKASQGTNFVDPYYLINYNGAKENDLKVGFYHYLTARSENDARREAQHFAAVISGLSPDCRLAMDFESFGDLSRSQINDISKAFLEELERLTKKELVIYSDASNARDIFSKELAEKYPLWIAEYDVQRPENNENWSQWVGWQYTSKGRVDGISGYTDRDYFTKDILLSDSSSIPESESKPISPDDTIEIIVKQGDTLSYIAGEYKTTVQRIEELNKIQNPNLIYIGERLLVPEVGAQKEEVEYIVKKGDTLNRIAKEYGVSVNDIVELNKIQNPNLIYIGQKLIIETRKFEKGDLNHILYTVKRGDTLNEISRKYNVSVNEIVNLNEIKNPNLIFVGEVLKIEQ